MLPTDEFDQRVAARLAEFWAWFTPWHRRLWNVGSISAIGELLEACESLPKAALKSLQAEVDRLVGPDSALGDPVTKEALGRLLNDNLVFQRASWYELSQLRPIVDAEYLKRWAHLVRGPDRPGIERVSRHVASHLLHSGFSSTYLHRWLRFQVEHRTDVLTIADLLDEADATLVRRPLQEFKVVIPVMGAPGITESPPAEWLSASQIANLIESIQGHRSDHRQNGGFVLAIRARDLYVAVERARELIDRWDARAELSTRNKIVRTKMAWVEGFNEPVAFTPLRRQVDIGALSRQSQIYAPLTQDETSVKIDDALQLVQPMEAGPRSAAISGGWAAIEALLTQGQEAENLAAPRLASIIACSYPRAELTTLSFFHVENATDPLAVALSDEDENVKRARLMADAISRGDTIAGRGPQDTAAVDRMREVVNNPRITLKKVCDYVEVALNRLYRQRNLMLHGGRVTGDGRLEALATAPPLIGAGLDRIAHAWFAEGTHPVELVARARLHIELAGTAAGRRVTDLLEPL